MELQNIFPGNDLPWNLPYTWKSNISNPETLQDISNALIDGRAKLWEYKKHFQNLDKLIASKNPETSDNDDIAKIKKK